MWNLDKLAEINYREHIDIAFPANSNPEKISEDEKNKLLEFYALYEQNLGRPSPDLVGSDTRNEFRKHIHDSYDLVQDKRKLSHLRSAIKLLAESCPYCGYGPIQELDHLLQRGHYNLFSIFPLNLVPSCGTCNRGKRKIPSANPSEHQIHVYLEDLSKYEFLKVNVSISAETGGLQALYAIEQCPNMPDDVYHRLVNHLIALELQSRYEKQINIYLGELEYSITSTFADGGPNALQKYLAGNAGALKKRFGANDWRTALMLALSTTPEFYNGGFKTALGLRLPPAAVEAQ